MEYGPSGHMETDDEGERRVVFGVKKLMEHF